MLLRALFMMLVGLALVVPRGSAPGSEWVRNVDLGIHGIRSTSGYQGAGDSRRAAVVRVLLGLGLIAGGVLMIALVSG